VTVVRVYPFVLHLQAPAIVTEPGGDPNGVATAHYIPGTAMRGWIARALTAGYGTRNAAQVQDLILSGRVRYLNAYPMAGERRSLPVPLSWRRPKRRGSDGEVYDLAGYDADTDWPDEQLQRVPHQHVALGSADPAWVPTVLGERVHHQQDRAKGRAWREIRSNGEEIAHGTLFSYRFLAEGQRFGGALLVEGESDADIEARFGLVRSLCGEHVFVGRSRRAGYGGAARIEWLDPRSREAEGGGLLSSDLDAGQVFRAILLSDYVGRNAVTGQVDPDWLTEELQQALGGRATVEHRFSEHRIVGGFNRTWGLELPQSLAARAGSVVVMKATAPIPLDDVLKVERNGLGERRVEGFGRVAFWSPASQTLQVKDARRGELAQPPPGEPPPLVQEIERRLVDEFLSREITLKSGVLEVTNAPTSSLIGRLRTPLRGEPGLALETLRRWLGEAPGALRRPALRQLSDCRIELWDGRTHSHSRRSLRDWLATVANAPLEEWWGEPGAIAERTYLVSPRSVRGYLDRPDVQDRVRVMLLDAVLGRIALAARRGKGRDGGP
jgi:CRISPR-associated protein Csx10